MNQQMLLSKATAYLVVQKDVKSNKKPYKQLVPFLCLWEWRVPWTAQG